MIHFVNGLASSMQCHGIPKSPIEASEAESVAIETHKKTRRDGNASEYVPGIGGGG